MCSRMWLQSRDDAERVCIHTEYTPMRAKYTDKQIMHGLLQVRCVLRGSDNRKAFRIDEKTPLPTPAAASPSSRAKVDRERERKVCTRHVASGREINSGMMYYARRVCASSIVPREKIQHSLPVRFRELWERNAPAARVGRFGSFHGYTETELSGVVERLINFIRQTRRMEKKLFSDARRWIMTLPAKNCVKRSNGSEGSIVLLPRRTYVRSIRAVSVIC